MNKQMIICGEEELYVLRLADMLADREELDLQVQVCTSFEQEERLEEFQEAEILLIGDEIQYEKRQTSRAVKRFVLVDREGKEVGEEETPIYKYQSVQNIFSGIMETCLDNDRAEIFQVTHKSGQKLIVIYSPIHRIGKTLFAKELGRTLAAEEPTLYINMQEYSGEWEGDRKEQPPSLADLLYYSRQERNHLGLRLTSMVREQEGVDMIAPIPISQDLKEVEKENWISLILQILKKGPYRNLILDVSESVQGLFEILNLCDVWYLPFIEDEWEEKKLDQFFEMLKRTGQSKLCEKGKMIEMRGGTQACVKRALQYDKSDAYAKATGNGSGEAGSFQRDRRRRTVRSDLSGTGRIYKRNLPSSSDEDGIWERSF